MDLTSRAVRAVVAGLVVLLPHFALAQTNTGRILGTVSDSTGAAISGATVTITDVSRGTVRVLATDAAGAYTAPNLVPSVYKVRAEAKGFKVVERDGIQLEVAKDVAIDISLPPGNVSQTVVVSGGVPLLDTTSATLGGTLSNKEINDLPLNGRNYENLLQLRPGVVRYPGGGFSTTSTNGLRAEDNAYLIDGLFNSEPFSGQSIVNGAGIAGDSATILPIDSIQEFNVQQNPPAEYGWKPGAIVNVGLKSGTNDVHGTGYAFGRDTPFDARNYFNPLGTVKQPRNLEQFGGTLGGAIIKNRLFYFGGYEGQRYTVGNIGQLQTYTTVPLPSASNCTFIAAGDCTASIPDAIADVYAGSLLGQNAGVSPVSLAIAGCTFTPPGTVSCNGKGFPTNLGKNPADPTFITFGLPNTVQADNAVGKIDFNLNDRNSITGRYFFGNSSGTVSDAGQLQPQWLTQIHTRAQVFGVNWTWVPSSRWVNEARFGYNRLYQPTFTSDHNVPASAYGLNTGVTNPLYGGLPRINVFPFYIFPQELGGFNWPKIQGPDDRFQFVDHIAYTRGRHALKFGAELHRDGFSGGAYGGARGRIKFIGGGAWTTGNGSSGLEDFFAGVPTNATQLVGDPTRQIHNWGYAAFVQDDFRITHTLTLNFGLRYEINTVVKEAHDLLGNFDPNLGLLQVGKQISSPYNGDHNNFAPRAGFAWDMFGKGTTVLRGGGGVMYETINWESFLALNNSLGISTIPTGAAGVSPGGGSIAVGTVFFPGSSLNWDPAITGIPGTVFPTTPIDCGANPCSIMGINRNLRTPFVANWTLSLQHAFDENLSMEVAYVGNHGFDLVNILDLNQAPAGSGWTPAAIAAGAADTDAEQAARPYATKFPFLANIYQMGNLYRSNYNGLQATLTARNYHGLSAVAGYTWSHALDQVGANWDFGAGLGLPSDSTYPGREYASSDFDIRNRFTLSATYLIPGKKSFAQLLQGWQINSIVTLASAQPFGVMDAGTDISGSGALNDRWNFFGNTSDFRSTPTGIPFFPGTSNPTCLTQAQALDGGPGGLTSQALGLFGCYANRNSILLPPALGSFGQMGRNIFRDTGFRDWDFSVAKNWTFHERFGAQFRVEFFNILNHPNFANPFGGQNGWAHNDPSTGSFGCACATPDVAASNPVIGSGGSRAIQLGMKLNF